MSLLHTPKHHLLACGNVDPLVSISSKETIKPFSLLKSAHELPHIYQQLQPDIKVVDAYPSTPLQDGLIALSMKWNGAFSPQIVCRLPEGINILRFKRAWQHCVNQNSTLRTVFVQAKTTGLVQVVLAPEPIEWREHSCLKEYLKSGTAIAPKFGSQMVRHAIIRDRNSGGTYFVWTFNHAVIDGWAMKLLLEQVDEYYQTGACVSLLEFSYFIKFFSRRLSLFSKESERFWDNYLMNSVPSAFPPLLSEKRPETFCAKDFKSMDIKIPTPLYSIATNSTIIQAAWAVVVGRRVGAAEVTYGMVLAGRNLDLPGIKTINGPTFTTIPFRLALDDSQTPEDLFKHIHELRTAIKPHQHLGLQNIRRLGPGAANACSFENMLVIQPRQVKNPNSLFNDRINTSDHWSKLNAYALMMQCNITDDGFVANASFDSRRMSIQDIDLLLLQFQDIIKQFFEGLNRPIAYIQLCKTTLAGEDISIPIIETGVELIETCVHESISRTARNYMLNPAVESWDGNLTYQQLEDLSDCLAHRLRASKVGPEVMVGLIFEKSTWAVVAIIAVLKAGGVFVSFDPSHPEIRLRDHIDQTGISLLLCSEILAAMSSKLAKESVVVSKSSLLQLPCVSKIACSDIRAENACYVIFTSGTTSKPKACVIEHGTCYTTCLQLAATFEMDSSTRMLQLSSYAFDGCILEILVTLSVGGCVCIPSQQEKMNDVTGAINRLQVNTLLVTPTFGRLITPSSVSSIKTLILGGETFMYDDFDRWFGNGRRLYEAYGPTECCIICLVNEIKAVGTNTSLIGVPIIGSYAVLDDNMQQVKPGDFGELYISGPHLARGYFGDLEKTASSFIATPTSLKKYELRHSRWYKTGDLVRWDIKASNFEYIGRKDTQVKLNGQRVELAEIEFCLRQTSYNAADLSVVVAEPNDKKSFLVAFICEKGEKSKTSTELCTDNSSPRFVGRRPLSASTIGAIFDNLVKRLPEYMIPKVYIPLDYMPLTTSGKLDRKLLQKFATEMSPAEVQRFSGSQTVYSHPVGEKELRLQRVWAATLNIQPETISRNDNFIRLGGDSILAMKLVAMAREGGLQVTVADVFRSPVLSDLAKISKFLDMLIEQETKVIPPFHLVGSQATVQSILASLSTCYDTSRDIVDLYPATPFQQAIMALSLTSPGTYVAQHVFELPKAVSENLDTFCVVWDRVVASTPILRTKLIETDACGLMQAVTDDKIAWKHHDNLERFLRMDKSIPFGIGAELNRHAIVTCTESGLSESYFVWTMHHACYDGWSMRLTLQDVEVQYKLLTSTERCNLGVHLPFNKFIGHLQELNVEEARKFWQAELGDGEPSSFPLTTAGYCPRPSSTYEHKIKLERKVHSDLRTSTFIRAAWAITVSTYANTNDVVFGATLSGRSGSSADLENIVGPLITTVPVRIWLDPQISMLDYLRSVEISEVNAMPFEQFGLSRIRLIDEKVKAACNFQNLLIIQPEDGDDLDSFFLGPRLRKYINADVFDTYALTMECSVRVNEICATAIYDPSVVPEAQIYRAMLHFEHILNQLYHEDGDKTIADMSNIGPSDANEIQKWNSTIPQPMDACVHHIIERKMLQDPNAPAICSWDGDLSRGELDKQVSALARKLIEYGVGIGSKVPILFHKSKWAVISILALIKAGAAFVPLDPQNPVPRLVSVVDQIDASIILCSTELEKLCSASFPRIQALVIDAQIVAGLASEPIPPFEEFSSTNDLYLVFTSGTTGSPKGTTVQHGAYCSGARDHAKVLGFEESSRFLQFASYAFDTSVETILTTLMTGGCLCIPSEEERNSDIVGAIARMRVNTADLTPSFISSFTPDDVPSLRRLILGGEPLTSKVIKTWANRVHLINGYGVTECCVTSLVNADISPETSPANIGRATGAVSWIVDASDSSRLLPIGAIGELLIEGPAIARGYLNDPEQTRRSFIDNAVWNSPLVRAAGRHYKTGDLAQYNSDGTINYIGRKDTQVKLRGQRIELGDIESHLVDHPHVRSALVILPSSGPYKGSITALIEFQIFSYAGKKQDIKLIPNTELEAAGVDWNGMSDFLRERVPSYMLPSSWLPVENLPLNTSGKLDRSRLGTWIQSLSARHETRNERTSTTNQVIPEEDTVAMELSKRIADMFPGSALTKYDAKLSDIGFDSIKMMSLAATIKRVYGVSVPVSVLINHNIRISDVAKQIKIAKQGINLPTKFSIDLMNEFNGLDQKLQALQNRIGVVFLTGATGLLGIQILRQLVAHPGVDKVVALVRASNSVEALKRLKISAKSACWSMTEFPSKVEAWNGDLCTPRLGIKKEQWATLINMDAIIHNGASVNWNSDYHTLKSANVDSTIGLLEAVHRAGPTMKFLYVTGGRSFDDNEPLESIFSKLSTCEGYSQTKFLSEALVAAFAKREYKRGAPPQIRIVEPGLIMGTAEEGVASTTDFIWRYVAGAVRIGVYPEPAEEDWLEIKGSDEVARAIIDALLQPSDVPDLKIQITDRISMPDFWKVVIAHSGHDLAPVSSVEWKKRIQIDIERAAEAHPLWPVAHLIEADRNLGKRGGCAPSEKDVDRMLSATIGKNVDFLVQCGFLCKSEVMK